MPRAVHRNDARTAVVGIVTIVVLVVVGAIGAVAQLGGPLPGLTYTYVQADIEDVGIMNREKDVRQGGVRIGEVSDIELIDGGARVTMRLEGDHEVYRDATVQVGNSSALGRKFLDLDRGSPEAGELGEDVIPFENTRGDVSLSSVLDVFDEPTRDALSSTAIELGEGLGGHGGNINAALLQAPGMLEDLDVIATALADPETRLDALLTRAESLTGSLSDREEALADTMRQTERTLSALAVDGGEPLEQTIAALPQTLSNAKTALDDLHDPLADVGAATGELQPGAAALGDSVNDVRGLLVEGVTPVDKVPGVADDAVPAVDSLTTAMHDLRPLAPRLGTTLDEAATLLAGLSPYSSDVGRFFSQHDFLSGTVAPGQHFFAASVSSLSTYTLGGVPIGDPIITPEPYPEPGGGAWEPR